MAPLRCAYLDLDGTLLGRGASLVHDGEGRPSLLGVRAVEACLRADVEVVLVSGRRAAQMAEDSRLLGQRAYVFEAGAGLVVDGDTYWSTGDFDPESATTIHDQIEATGAPALLLDQYAGRFEYHEPWHLNRQVSHLFRGLVDVAEADALVGRHGLRLVDNGVVHRRSAALPASSRSARTTSFPPRPRRPAPSRATCGCAATHREERSRSATRARTSAATTHVGTFWFVANALERDPTLRSAIAGRANVRVAEASHGAGVYEAVVTTLAEGRG